MPPTIYEVSKLAGVSLATVSRVLNNSGKVSPVTRKKVEDAMKELGYRPNSNAQSLASNRSNSVGVMVPVMYGPFYGDMLTGILSELREAGKHVIITTGDETESGEREGVEFLLSKSCDALILKLDYLPDEELVELGRGSVPVVVLDREIPDIADRCIFLDNELGGYLATRSVLVLGHRNIAYISGPLDKADAQARLAGHRRALEEFGVDFEPNLVVEGNFQESGGTRGMKQLLQYEQRFSVVVCANDEMAAGAFGVLRERDVRIPEEISIMGFDNVFFTEYFRPRLSTVNNPIREMGKMAALCVLKEVYGVDGNEIQHRFEPELVMRTSVSSKTGI